MVAKLVLATATASVVKTASSNTWITPTSYFHLTDLKKKKKMVKYSYIDLRANISSTPKINRLVIKYYFHFVTAVLHANLVFIDHWFFEAVRSTDAFGPSVNPTRAMLATISFDWHTQNSLWTIQIERVTWGGDLYACTNRNRIVVLTLYFSSGRNLRGGPRVPEPAAATAARKGHGD